MLIGFIVFLPFVFAFCSLFFGRKHDLLCDDLGIVFCLAELVLSLFLLRGASSQTSFAVGNVFAGGLFFTADGFRATYSLVTSVMWAGTTLFSREYFKEERENLNRYRFFVLLTLGATQGVMLSADLMTAFVFFEILSFTSFTWVIHEETPDAVKAAKTYLAVAVIGGLILFMGMLLMQHAAGTLRFSELKEAVLKSSDRNEVLAAGICILFGFGAKAGMFPLHIWLPKAHPVAPAPASALLSGILTKVGIYGILMTTIQAFTDNVSFGVLVFVLGVITMALGAVLAVFSVNLKRILACSSMSQIGFILTGTGMMVLLSAAGNGEASDAALSGVMLHMLNHSLLKLSLFTAAGVVVMNLHTLDLNEIRGWGRNKTFLKAAFALGGLGISGVPLFNGYISKTLLHEGIAAGIGQYPAFAAYLKTAEWIFLISGGATFAYMLKIFITVFVEKNPARQREFDRSSYCMNTGSTIAVFGSSLFAVILGQPVLMKKISAFMTGKNGMENFNAFSAENLKGSLISLGIGAFLYLFAVRRGLSEDGIFLDRWPKKLDLEDSVYRPLLLSVLPCFFGSIAAVFGENRILKPASKGIMISYRKTARVFGENRILKPVSKGVMISCRKTACVLGENRVLIPLCRFMMLLSETLGRLFSVSTDGIVLFLRKTVLREVKRKDGSGRRPGRIRILKGATGNVLREVTVNFTFSLFMTCIGILLMLGVLLFLILR